jgi:penicillin-binding protein 1C
MKATTRRIARLSTLFAVAAVFAAGPLAAMIFDWIYPLPLEKLHRPQSQIVEDRDGRPIRIFLAADDRWRLPLAFDEASPVLVETIVASEDRWFHRHPGVNPLSVLRAAWSNLRAGRIVSGSSTIPMQIARMIEPKDRTVSGKIWESLRAMQLEWRFSKEELLELYLNLIPMGGNLEGVGAAAHFYFGKHPSQIVLGEAALLAVLPRSPNDFDPIRRPQAALRVRDRLLDALEMRGDFSPEQVAAARRHPLPQTRRAAPFSAPHFSLLARSWRPTERRLRTSLDLNLQRSAEQLVGQRIQELRSQGIENVAVVALDNRTRTVRALVGSAGFHEERFQGQVNGALAARSPGSALKPLLFALALERGIIIPDSVLLDVPIDFSGYAPENYDGTFRGKTSAGAALVQSLNVPFVRLLHQYGVADFHYFLNRAGISSLTQPPTHYGLSLILGSGEVNLLELTNLYATLAQGGLHRPWSVLAESEPPEDRLFSPEAAWLTGRHLTQLRRPDLPSSWRQSRDAPAIAWKTGTSFRHRDGWAVGYDDDVSIGVWVGNFSGEPRKGLSGAEHAAPLLFDLFRIYSKGGAQTSGEPPVGLRLESLSLCAESRRLPGPNCERTVRAVYLPGKSRVLACDWHRRIHVERESGRMLAGACAGGPERLARTLLAPPPELKMWMQSQGMATDPMPEISPHCRDVAWGEPPRIVSPGPGAVFVLRPDAPSEHQQLRLSALSGSFSQQLYWFQNGVLKGKVQTGRDLFVPLQPGRHRVAVVDESGRTHAVTYEVRRP